MLISGFYAYRAGTKEALLYFVGWGFLLLTLVFAILQSLRIFNIFDYFRHTTELAFALEVFIFSIAVAYRIKRLNDEKEKLNATLCQMQEEEKERLEKQIVIRTQELELSLEEKDLLYQELQHRVKNNLAFIVSILELQIMQSNSSVVRRELEATTSRIHSLSSMYQLLLYDRESRLLNTQHYFEKILDYISAQFTQEVKISLDISAEIAAEKLLYYGLILNEVVTNSYKHAFDTGGEIDIKIYEQNGECYFSIKDNGKGYAKSDKITLGMTIVNTLVTKQLHAKIEIINDNGTEVIISSNKEEK
jgi:two-component sensor histidine kinase